jgi:hypothetical protein
LYNAELDLDLDDWIRYQYTLLKIHMDGAQFWMAYIKGEERKFFEYVPSTCKEIK